MVVNYPKKSVVLIGVSAFFVGTVLLIWKLGFTADPVEAVCVFIIIFGLPIATFFPLGLPIAIFFPHFSSRPHS
ncbi:hypothetical protein ABIB99_008983 [Bradyrhizobium sp. LA6.1]|uniref:hypothetical protein n=1 Tax=Bradyrhizobium sp. LA6.1 TaxID=3156378 RepID=UPI0033956CB1